MFLTSGGRHDLRAARGPGGGEEGRGTHSLLCRETAMNDHTAESATSRPVVSVAAPYPAPDKTYGYSRLFGTFYERGSALEQRINAAKASMGESAVKHGYTSLTPAARAEVIGTELVRDPVTVRGIFEGAGFYRHEASGQEYVRVRLRNEHGLSSVSVALDSDLGKSMVRHLANPEVRLGAPMSLQAFASTRVSEVDGRPFANHAAAMWQGARKIEGISKATLEATKGEMRARFAAIGIDAKTARSALYRLEADWHRDRLREVTARLEGREVSESAIAANRAKDPSAREVAEEQDNEQDMGR